MAAVDKLVQPRRAMQLTLLASAAIFFGIAMAIVVAMVDAHWLWLGILSAVFLGAVFVIGPKGYAIEQRPHNRVRLHRAVGVVDLDLAPPIEVKQRWGRLALRSNGKTYRMFRTVGSASVIDEWLRRVAR